MLEKTNPFLEIFEDPDQAARYDQGPAKFVPGFSGVHRMVHVLMQERAPETANILVHGAGGGLELEFFARANSRWRFVGVDPAKPMLDVAAERLGPLMARTQLHHGYIDDAPDGPFDAATSLLTLHFLEAEERRRTIKEIARRLKPGAPLITIHSSFPDKDPERELMLSRYAAFAVASGVDAEMARKAREGVSAAMPRVSPEQDEKLLAEAGLKDVRRFYSAFAWHGWVGYA